ncbi:hypothetical protein F4823DRAFT_255613 [Ustulina deusta]|nr:hypothetical protein F4823DRAFT_255613 [Ustulina deusta]
MFLPLSRLLLAAIEVLLTNKILCRDVKTPDLSRRPSDGAHVICPSYPRFSCIFLERLVHYLSDCSTRIADYVCCHRDGMTRIWRQHTSVSCSHAHDVGRCDWLRPSAMLARAGSRVGKQWQRQSNHAGDVKLISLDDIEHFRCRHLLCPAPRHYRGPFLPIHCYLFPTALTSSTHTIPCYRPTHTVVYIVQYTSVVSISQRRKGPSRNHPI